MVAAITPRCGGVPGMGTGSRALPGEAVKGQWGDSLREEGLGDVFLGLEKEPIGSSSRNGERGQLPLKTEQEA